MLIEKLCQIGFLADHMFSRGNKNSARIKHAKHFPACAIEIAGVMQHGSRKYDIESDH